MINVQVSLPEEKVLRVISTGRFDYFKDFFSHVGNDTHINLTLYHESENTNDRNAIKVCCGTIPVGYLVREDAFEFNHTLHVIKNLEDSEKLKVTANFIDFAVHKMDDGRSYRNILLQIKKRG